MRKLLDRLRRLLGPPAPKPQLDQIGPATIYPDRSGSVRRVDPAPYRLPAGPLMTLAGEWRASGRAWQL